MRSINKRQIVSIFRTIRRERKVNSTYIEYFILIVIFINSITIGMETSDYLWDKYKLPLRFIDTTALVIFTVEIGSKILIMRWRFFRNPWNIFDFVIIGASYIPFFCNLSVLRSLRILRIFLIVSFMPKLRMIVESLLNSLPGILGISILLVLVFYAFGVIGTQSFGHINEEHFGNLGKSLFSLFQVMTLDSWSTFVREIVKEKPYSVIFFIPFVLLTSYIIVNIFIAIIVNSMREARLKYEEKERKAEIASALSAEEKREEEQLRILLEKLNSIDERLVKIDADNAEIKRNYNISH